MQGVTKLTMTFSALVTKKITVVEFTIKFIHFIYDGKPDFPKI